MSEEAKKFDGGKPRTDLLPFMPIMQVADILGFGSIKYGDNNWRKGDKAFATRCLGASLRHLFKFMSGTEKDEESGMSHLAHAACDILMAMELFDKEKKVDERAST